MLLRVLVCWRGEARIWFILIQGGNLSDTGKSTSMTSSSGATRCVLCFGKCESSGLANTKAYWETRHVKNPAQCWMSFWEVWTLSVTSRSHWRFWAEEWSAPCCFLGSRLGGNMEPHPGLGVVGVGVRITRQECYPGPRPPGIARSRGTCCSSWSLTRKDSACGWLGHWGRQEGEDGRPAQPSRSDFLLSALSCVRLAVCWTGC